MRTSDYILNGQIISRVQTFTDLGVVLDSAMPFDSHIRAMAAKGASMIGFLKRNCHHVKDPFTIMSLCEYLVRSHLEYCCVVWNPTHLSTYELWLEKVQRQFTRYPISKLR